MTQNLPKPPPKAPPRPAPGVAPASTPAAAPTPAKTPTVAAPAAAKPSLPAKPGLPALPAKAAAPISPAAASAAPTAVRPQAQPTSQPAAQAPRPAVEIPGLPDSLSNMVEAITLFEQVLEEENLLLRAHNADGVVALQERKQAAAKLYQERLRTLGKDGSVVGSVNEEQRDKLLALVRRLDDKARENARLLQAHMHAIEQLFETINTAVQSVKHQDLTYSRKGEVSGGLTTSAAAMAFNTTA